MAVIDLTTYTGLRDAVAQYLNRRDLNDQIPAFILQAEAKLNRELATARIRDMMAEAEGTVSTKYIPVPVDFVTTYSLELQQNSVWGSPIEYITEETARELRSIPGQDGLTRFYSIYGQNFELLAAPAGGNPIPYRLRYFSKIAPLMSNSTNWLLAKSPDLYLTSSCLEAALYLKGDERIPTWNAFRSQIIESMRLESEQALRPQGALKANPRTFG